MKAVSFKSPIPAVPAIAGELHADHKARCLAQGAKPLTLLQFWRLTLAILFS